MKRIISFIAVVVTFLVVASCYYDEVLDSGDGLPQNVSFNRDVMAIFNKSCNMSGCHDQDPPRLPSLTPANAFNSLHQGGFINTTVPAESRLYGVLSEGVMPPSGTLGSRDLKIILAWLNDGALNN